MGNLTAWDMGKNIDFAFRRPNFISLHRTGYVIFRTWYKMKMENVLILWSKHTHIKRFFLSPVPTLSLSRCFLFADTSDGVYPSNAALRQCEASFRVTSEPYRCPSPTTQHHGTHLTLTLSSSHTQTPARGWGLWRLLGGSMGVGGWESTLERWGGSRNQDRTWAQAPAIHRPIRLHLQNAAANTELLQVSRWRTQSV